MKRFSLVVLISCLMVNQASADWTSALLGGMFTAGCGVLGENLGKKTMPNSPYAGRVGGMLAGLLASRLATWGLLKLLITKNVTNTDSGTSYPTLSAPNELIQKEFDDVVNGEYVAAGLYVLAMLVELVVFAENNSKPALNPYIFKK